MADLQKLLLETRANVSDREILANGFTVSPDSKGLRVDTAITEGTTNVLVNRRMNKLQQMRWSRRGADLLFQVRCAVYNGTFGSGFGQRFHPANALCPPVAIAA